MTQRPKPCSSLTPMQALRVSMKAGGPGAVDAAVVAELVGGGPNGDSLRTMADDDETRPSRPPQQHRRSSPRVAATFRVRYSSLDELVVAYSEDVSRGGMYLVTTRFLPVGAVSQVKVVLPDDAELQTIMRVAYVLDEERAAELGRKPGMGMQFLDVEGQPFAEQIASFIQRETGAGGAERESVPPAVERCRVLVVDDVASQRRATVAALERAGHEVLTADSGVTALGQALKHQPDLILSDVEMPALDGWQLLRLLRARPSLADTSIIFLTSLSGDRERLRGYRLGVDDYIPKPFVEAELIARVDRVLGQVREHPRSVQGSKALRGALEHVSLASLLSFLELERRTARLLLVRDQGMATVWLREGRVVRVQVSGPHGEAEPLERLMHVLDWTRGRFELADDDGVAQDEIGLPTSQLLLEHARRSDEHDR